MMLPATLEGLLGAGNEAAEAQVDAEWLDRVSCGVSRTNQIQFWSAALRQETVFYIASSRVLKMHMLYVPVSGSAR